MDKGKIEGFTIHPKGSDFEKWHCEKNDTLLKNKFCEALDLMETIYLETSKNNTQEIDNNLVSILKMQLSELLIELSQLNFSAYDYLVKKARKLGIVKF